MSLHIDALADLVRQSVVDGDTTREDWQRAIDQVFPATGNILPLDPVEGTGTEKYLVTWTIDQSAVSAADAAQRVWQEFFLRDPSQPSNDSACVFHVTNGDRSVQIDLSDQQFAPLFTS